VCSCSQGGTSFASHQFNLFSSSILGFNGAGKSNLFQAIQLCLADAQYDKMSTQERIALLHEVRLQQFEKKKINHMRWMENANF
jgi:chromosome segregation ATPase